MSNKVHEDKKVKEKKMCTKKEQVGHALGVLGHDSAYSMWSTWMLPFLTDILVLPTAFIGILTTFARFFDGFTDIFMGVIADRTKTKWGRFRPWVLRAGPVFCLLMVLSFVKFPVDTTAMCVIAAVLYIVTGSIAFTAVDIPFWSLPAAMTSNTDERSSIIGSTTTASNFITGLLGVLMPLMLAAFGTYEWTSYFYIAAPIGIFAAIMYISCFKMVREHVVSTKNEGFSLRLALRNIFKNQPLLCVQLANIFVLGGMMLRNNLMYYYCQYNLQNVALATPLNLIGTIGMVVGAILFSFFAKYIGKKNCMFVIVFVYAASNLILYFSGWDNYILLCVCSAFITTMYGAAIVCINAMMADTIEYGEWKTGQRNEAMITSTRCFVTKCVSALAGIAVLVVIGTTGMNPEAAVQAPAVLDGFHFLFTLVNAGIMIFAAIPMLFYKLTEKRHAEIMVELTERNANINKQ